MTTSAIRWVGTQPLKSSSYLITMDYSEASFTPTEAAIIQNILTDGALDQLSLPIPTVWAAFLNPSYLGNYIGGTSTAPHIGIAVVKLRASAKRNHVSLTDALTLTLYHEFCHAYLESRGLNTEDGHDEDLVEMSANRIFNGDFRSALAILDSLVH